MRYRAITALAAAGIVLGGCSLTKPHNDVMVFGTTTQVGAHISAPVQNAGIPSISVGYNRQEAVWMPLREVGAAAGQGDDDTQELVTELNTCMQGLASSVPDADARSALCLSLVLEQSKYVSIARGVNPDTGGSELEIDTYSVFASFGARGSASNRRASGQLAQFFATGIAAQRLGANQNVSAALNTDAPAALEEQASLDRLREERLQQEAEETVKSNLDRAEALRESCFSNQAWASEYADQHLNESSEAEFMGLSLDRQIRFLAFYGGYELSNAEEFCRQKTQQGE